MIKGPFSFVIVDKGIGSVTHQELNHFEITDRSHLHQWSSSRTILRVHITSFSDDISHEITPFIASCHQRVVSHYVLDREINRMLQQITNYFSFTLHDCRDQSSVSFIILSIDVASCRKKTINNSKPLHHTSPHQGRSSLVISGFFFSPSGGQEKVHNIDMSVLRSDDHRSQSLIITIVDGGSCSDQKLHNISVSLSGRCLNRTQ